MTKIIDLYGDGIGKVEYVQHVGDDRTIVNSARVSFGKEVEEIDEKDKNDGKNQSRIKLYKKIIKRRQERKIQK